MPPFDLRSDTVTKPTPAMREAMARADVGDDIYGEDPTVRALEETVASLLGKERALFVPSGTMANQISIWVQTRPGDEVIVGENAHCALYESGAGAAISGVQFRVAGQGGLFDADEMEAAVQPDIYYVPRTSLVALENTHNRAGGRIFPSARVREIQTRARAKKLALHLDGSRLWNTSAATGVSLSELASGFDTVNVCFSKGLGAPVGSAIAASEALITEARRRRKVLGGGMRQSGILAAAALYALEHHRPRIAEDHEKAQVIAAVLAGAKGARVDVAAVETNIVNVALAAPRGPEVSRMAREQGVLVHALTPGSLRLVTHLDISLADARRAAEILAQVIGTVLGANVAS